MTIHGESDSQARKEGAPKQLMLFDGTIFHSTNDGRHAVDIEFLGGIAV